MKPKVEESSLHMNN